MTLFPKSQFIISGVAALKRLDQTDKEGEILVCITVDIPSKLLKNQPVLAIWENPLVLIYS